MPLQVSSGTGGRGASFTCKVAMAEAIARISKPSCFALIDAQGCVTRMGRRRIDRPSEALLARAHAGRDHPRARHDRAGCRQRLRRDRDGGSQGARRLGARSMRSHRSSPRRPAFLSANANIGRGHVGDGRHRSRGTMREPSSAEVAARQVKDRPAGPKRKPVGTVGRPPLHRRATRLRAIGRPRRRRHAATGRASETRRCTTTATLVIPAGAQRRSGTGVNRCRSLEDTGPGLGRGTQGRRGGNMRAVVPAVPIDRHSRAASPDPVRWSSQGLGMRGVPAPDAFKPRSSFKGEAAPRVRSKMTP